MATTVRAWCVYLHMYRARLNVEGQPKAMFRRQGSVAIVLGFLIGILQPGGGKTVQAKKVKILDSTGVRWLM